MFNYCVQPHTCLSHPRNTDFKTLLSTHNTNTYLEGRELLQKSKVKTEQTSTSPLNKTIEFNDVYVLLKLVWYADVGFIVYSLIQRTNAFKLHSTRQMLTNYIVIQNGHIS